MAYLTTVLLLMLVLPVGSIWVEQSFLRGTVPLMMLVGKWFVFWAAGGGAGCFSPDCASFFSPVSLPSL
jgi:hypothetical protein